MKTTRLGGRAGAVALSLYLLAACGGVVDLRTDEMAGGAGTGGEPTFAGTKSVEGGSPSSAGKPSSGGKSSAGGSISYAGSMPAVAGSGPAQCNPTPGPTSGNGTNTGIDSLDDDNITFRTAGVGMGSWDFSKDMSSGTINPVGTAALVPVAGGKSGKALHVRGSGLTGWGAALSAVLDGWQSSFDASKYGGIAFSIKGTTQVVQGSNVMMILARMPDTLPGVGSCCYDGGVGTGPTGYECYSSHRVLIEVPATWKEVKLAWSDFTNAPWGYGMFLEFDPNRLRDIVFAFDHNVVDGDVQPTSFDVWIDGLRFLEVDETGTFSGVAGSGGSSGSSGSGGSDDGSAGAGGKSP